jgi:hypothetical protein
MSPFILCKHVGRSGSIVPLILSSILDEDECSALIPGRFAPGNRLIEGCMDLRAVLDVSGKKERSRNPSRNLNHDSKFSTNKLHSKVSYEPYY